MRSVLGSAPLAGGAGGGAAAGALRQELQAAIEASPCVLHLRGITSLAAGEQRVVGRIGDSCSMRSFSCEVCIFCVLFQDASAVATRWVLLAFLFMIVSLLEGRRGGRNRGGQEQSERKP